MYPFCLNLYGKSKLPCLIDESLGHVAYFGQCNESRGGNVPVTSLSLKQHHVLPFAFCAFPFSMRRACSRWVLLLYPRPQKETYEAEVSQPACRYINEKSANYSMPLSFGIACYTA